LGHKAHVISLDDFYGEKEDAPRFPDGTPDLEAVEALDVPLLGKTLSRLLAGGRCELPVFDFTQGRRAEKINPIFVNDADVIVVEGLHALNPVITELLPISRVFRLYISVSSRIYNAHGEIVLNKRNIRFVRRLVRDYFFRSSSVENTFAIWPGVLAGEDAYLFPYKNLADQKINSVHLYEFGVLRDLAVSLLSRLPKAYPGYARARRLMQALGLFEKIEKAHVPSGSLLREFIGK
jgi:uridine kinase